MSHQQLVITGIDGGKAANQLLQAHAVLNTSVPNDVDHKARNSILAEMAVASGTGDVRIFAGAD